MDLLNGTLFGEKVFADVIKLRIWRSSRIIGVGPECNHKGPYKEKARGEDRQKREEGHVKMETEMGVMWPRTKETGSHQKRDEAGLRGKRKVQVLES